MSGLVADPEGHVWVRPYRPESGMPERWWVVDLSGGLLGQVELPTRFRPMAIGADYVLGITTDELDVPLVRMYRLRR